MKIQDDKLLTEVTVSGKKKKVRQSIRYLVNTNLIPNNL